MAPSVDAQLSPVFGTPRTVLDILDSGDDQARPGLADREHLHLPCLVSGRGAKHPIRYSVTPIGKSSGSNQPLRRAIGLPIGPPVVAAGHAALVASSKQVSRGKVGKRMATHDTSEHADDEPDQHEREPHEDDAGHQEGRQRVANGRAHRGGNDHQTSQDEDSLDSVAPAPPIDAGPGAARQIW